MTQAGQFEIAAATRADIPLLLTLIGELAEYEKLSHEAVATEESLAAALFGARPSAEAVIARRNRPPRTFSRSSGLTRSLSRSTPHFASISHAVSSAPSM